LLPRVEDRDYGGGFSDDAWSQRKKHEIALAVMGFGIEIFFKVMIYLF
jgi:hypothetical protein